MNSALTMRKPRGLIYLVLFLQIITWTTVFLDVPVIRQVIGFVYITVIPGFIIFRLMNLDNMTGLETALFSIGFSVLFLMIAGLLLNNIGFLFGISDPLSLIPLMTVVSGFVIVGTALIYLRSDEVKIWNVKNFNLNPVAFILILLPILSMVGAVYVNSYNSNVIFLFLIIIIAVIFAVGSISEKFLPKRLYPLALLMIGLALLFQSSFISEYICTYGSDVPTEYFVFKTTQNNAHWDSLNYLGGGAYARIHSMLSVTILPTVESTLLNIDATLIFKLVYPIIFSFVPLGLYQLWKGYLDERYAFIAAFFFIAYNVFYTEMLGLNRQIVAELFFVLLLLVVLNKKLKPSSKVLCFTFLSFGLVTSHYGLSEIFLFLISFIAIWGLINRRPSKNITTSMVVIFFIIMFTWYIYMSGSAVFDSFVEFSGYLYNQLGDFFDISSRGTTVLRGLGLEAPPTIWNAISRAFAYGTQFFIVVGFLGLIMKRINTRFDRDSITLSFISMLLLGALLIVPGLANTLNMTRFYHILLIFLAPLCVLGADVLLSLISKRKTKFMVSFLLLILLTPYFVFQTGFVYEVTETEAWSLPLSKSRMNGFTLYRGYGYIDAESVFGAIWIKENVDLRKSQLYADLASKYNVLTIYGFIYGNVLQMSNTTIISDNGIVYLGPLNTIHGVVNNQYHLYNTSELSFLNSMNKIYSNGGSEIYKQP